MQTDFSNQYEIGQFLKVKVVKVSKDYIFVDLGTKSEGIISKDELIDFKDDITVGKDLDVIVIDITDNGEIILSQKLAGKKRSKEMIWQAYQAKLPIEGKVTGVNKGGLEVVLGDLKGFCPLSQIEASYCEDPSQYVGKSLNFVIVEHKGDDGLVLSRRILIEEENKRKSEEIRKIIVLGAELEGEVVSIKPFGAFVDLGGIQGMVHISELSYSHVTDPQEILSIGNKVKVRIIDISEGKKKGELKVALSIKALERPPWEEAKDRLKIGEIFDGKVTKIQNFGVFVEILPGVEGLVPVVEISDMFINHPREAINVGENVRVKVLDINLEQKRITLSIREASADEKGRVNIEVGEILQARVAKVRPYGLHVQIIGAGRKGSAFIPFEECDLLNREEIRKKYPVGANLTAQVIDYDKENQKIKMSLKSLKEKETDDDLEEFKKELNVPQHLGTFGDLLKMKKIELK